LRESDVRIAGLATFEIPKMGIQNFVFIVIPSEARNLLSVAKAIPQIAEQAVPEGRVSACGRMALCRFFV
jgi:hypothetical protein